MKISGISSNQFLLWAILIVYISISHIFLPVVKARPYSTLFFSKWNLFSFPPYTFIRDITWDGGQSFLLRDYRKEAVYSGVPIEHIFFLFHKGLSQKHAIKLQKYMRRQILNFCKCQKFSVVLLDGSLSDHIIYRKQLKILQEKYY